MKWWWTFRRKPRPPATTVADAASAALAMLPSAPVTSLLAPTAIVQAEATIQGYAPIVFITERPYGTRCTCRRLVLRDVRHICIYNAHHHMESLSTEERMHLIWDLDRMADGLCIHDWQPVGWHRWYCSMCPEFR